MLQLKNIYKSYKTKDFTQDVLDNVNITFRKNEFVSVLGKSGSGKTTLLNILGGLDNYTKGDLIINGKSSKKFKDLDFDYYRNNLVGFIFQNYNLINHISVLKNVEMSLTLNGVSFKKKRKKALLALKKVGLLQHANKKPTQLSGGQMQRIAIARAIVNDPKIILADEPTGALDSKNSKKIMDLINEIAKDKLVIMVTHDDLLAKEYSNRVIKISDGKIVSDSNPFKQDIANKDDFKIKKTKMSFLSSILLSIDNIKTKRTRVFLTSLASSVGIIGIALILSISNGFNKEVKKYEKKATSSFPISINEVSSLTSLENKNNNKSFDKNKLYVYEEESMIHKNKIDLNYVNYINKMDKSLLSAISYKRNTNLNLVSKNNNDYKELSSLSNLVSLPISIKNNNYIKENYDLLYGNYPKQKTDVVLIVDNNNKIDKSMLDFLGLNNKNEVGFDLIVGSTLKLISNDDFYKKINDDLFIKNKIDEGIYNKVKNKTLTIVGILKFNEKSVMNKLTNSISSALIAPTSKIGYNDDLLKDVVMDNKNSYIVKSQLNSNKIVFMGGSNFEELGVTKKEVLTMLGYDNLPSSINLYPTSYKSKNKVLKYLDSYNKDKDEKNKIFYTDYALSMTSMSSGIINAITIILVAFSSISLIVSSIMIGVITYISVLERTNEIGILRSLGARKKDVARVFNAESFIIGLSSGVIGVVITRLLLILINVVLKELTGLKNLAMLSFYHAFILIFISTLLTMIGGFIPAKIASKKNPVEALRFK